MKFHFVVDVEVERVTGKFLSKEDITAEIRDALESADPQSIQIDDSEYEVTDWSIDE